MLKITIFSLKIISFQSCCRSPGLSHNIYSFFMSFSNLRGSDQATVVYTLPRDILTNHDNHPLDILTHHHHPTLPWDILTCTSRPRIPPYPEISWHFTYWHITTTHPTLPWDILTRTSRHPSQWSHPTRPALTYPHTSRPPTPPYHEIYWHVHITTTIPPYLTSPYPEIYWHITIDHPSRTPPTLSWLAEISSWEYLGVMVVDRDLSIYLRVGWS